MTPTAWVSHFAEHRESGPMTTFTVHCEYPLVYRAEVTVEAEDAVSACRTAILSANETDRSEEHTSELQSLMRISYAVFCLKKKTHTYTDTHIPLPPIQNPHTNRTIQK